MSSSYINDCIENCRKLDVEVIRIHSMTHNKLLSIFNKNGKKIEEILIVMKAGEKLK